MYIFIGKLIDCYSKFFKSCNFINFSFCSSFKNTNRIDGQTSLNFALNSHHLMLFCFDCSSFFSTCSVRSTIEGAWFIFFFSSSFFWARKECRLTTFVRCSKCILDQQQSKHRTETNRKEFRENERMTNNFFFFLFSFFWKKDGEDEVKKKERSGRI